MAMPVNGQFTRAPQFEPLPLQLQPLSPNLLMNLRFPKLQAAVNDSVYNSNTHLETVWSSFFSAISVVEQPLIDVELPYAKRAVVPTSMIIISSNGSGGGKSTVDKMTYKPIREFQAREQENFSVLSAEYKIDHRVWSRRCIKLEKKYNQLLESGKDATQAKDVLREHMLNEPQEPIKFSMLYKVSTTEAFLDDMQRGFPSKGITSDEGGDILKSPVFNNMPLINTFYSGGQPDYKTKTSGEYNRDGVRVSVGIMVQPGMLDDYLENKGNLARASGLMARTLFFEPLIIPGKRDMSTLPPITENLTVYWNRLSEILEESLQIEKPGFQRKVLKFTRDAELLLCAYAQYVESQRQLGGIFEKAGDHAVRLPENAARLSALIHYFEEFEGDISVETLQDVISICQICSAAFMRRFVPPEQKYIDANEIYAWLCHRFNYSKNNEIRKRRYVPKSFTRKCRPGVYRDQGARYDRAIETLFDQGRIGLACEVYPDGSDGPEYIDMCPAYEPINEAGKTFRNLYE